MPACKIPSRQSRKICFKAKKKKKKLCKVKMWLKIRWGRRERY